MPPDRIDDLLERALERGVIPTEATPDERAAVQQLLNQAAALKRNASLIEQEASAAMPTTRARFQRHLADQRAGLQTPVALPAKPKRGVLSRWFGGCLLYQSDAADELLSVCFGGRRIIKKKKHSPTHTTH